MRRRKNLIKSLQNSNGDVISNINELEEMATQFYKDLFTSDGVTNMQEVMDTVPDKVTAAMNTSLNATYTNGEVKTSLFQTFPMKTPGPDGSPTHFFQKH